MKEAAIESKDMGERGISALSIKKATPVRALLLTFLTSTNKIVVRLYQTSNIDTAGYSREVPRLSSS